MRQTERGGIRRAADELPRNIRYWRRQYVIKETGRSGPGALCGMRRVRAGMSERSGPDYERMLRPDSGRNLRGMREMRENLPRRVY